MVLTQLQERKEKTTHKKKGENSGKDITDLEKKKTDL